jgi:hypothetical protein
VARINKHFFNLIGWLPDHRPKERSMHRKILSLTFTGNPADKSTDTVGGEVLPTETRPTLAGSSISKTIQVVHEIGLRAGNAGLRALALNATLEHRDLKMRTMAASTYNASQTR